MLRFPRGRTVAVKAPLGEEAMVEPRGPADVVCSPRSNMQVDYTEIP